MLNTLLMVFAFVFFAIAAGWNPPAPSPWFPRLVAAGLACWSLAILLNGAHIVL